MARPDYYARFDPRSGRSLLVVGCLVVVVLLFGIWLGRQGAYRQLLENPESVPTVSARLGAVREQLASVQADLAVQRTRNTVNREALEMLRRDMARQKEEFADLEENLRFYRSLMSPGEAGGELSVRDPEVLAGSAPGEYQFRFVVQQKAGKHDLVTASMQVEVFGERGEEPESYAIADISADIADQALPLQFRYFQAVEGTLVLPRDFRPEGLRFQVEARKPRKTEVSQEFTWRVQERFKHVGN